MPTSNSRLSYVDCFEILDKATVNKLGIKFLVPDHGAGNYLRVRLHTARKIDRQDNREAYEEGHKLFGRSIYDPLVIRLKQEDNKWWMYIEKYSAEALNIEPLGEENVLDQSTGSNLREASGASSSQSREEASEETHDVFSRKAEQEAESVAEGSASPVQARRRL